MSPLRALVLTARVGACAPLRNPFVLTTTFTWGPGDLGRLFEPHGTTQQPTSGAAVVLGAAAPAMVFARQKAGGCGVTREVDRLTPCGFASAANVPPGRVATGVELADESVPGPEVVIEPGGFANVTFMK